MKSKEIQKLFIEYMLNKNKNFRYANENEMPALIYGSDEFKIDVKKSRIKLDVLGWIKASDIDFDYNLKDIEWIAISCTEGNYSLIVSSDKNPFAESKENPMYIDGQIFGVPARVVPNILRNI